MAVLELDGSLKLAYSCPFAHRYRSDDSHLRYMHVKTNRNANKEKRSRDQGSCGEVAGIWLEYRDVARALGGIFLLALR